MPEPVTFVLGGVVLALVVALVGLNRFTRLRRHIEETADTVTEQREQRDALMDHLLESGQAPPDDPGQDPGDGALPEERLREQVAEAEDRLAAVNRLHTAQVRAWNHLGGMSPWRVLRGVTGWRALAEPSEEGQRAAVNGDERG